MTIKSSYIVKQLDTSDKHMWFPYDSLGRYCLIVPLTLQILQQFNPNFKFSDDKGNIEKYKLKYDPKHDILYGNNNGYFILYTSLDKYKEKVWIFFKNMTDILVYAVQAPATPTSIIDKEWVIHFPPLSSIIDYIDVNLTDVYKDVTGSWSSTVPNMINSRFFFGLAELDVELYAIGGAVLDTTHGVRNKAINLCERYDPRDSAVNQWYPIAPLKTERMWHSVVVCQGAGDPDKLIYAIGGNNGFGYLKTVEAYDGDSWNNVYEMNVARSNFGAAVLNNNIYAIGGVGDAGGDACERYDVNEAKVTTIASLSYPRTDHGVAALNDKIYVGGGNLFDKSTNTWTVTNSCEVYDPSNDKWTPIQSMLSARRAFQFVVMKGLLFAIGGYSGDEGQSILSECEIYDPSTDKWTAIPSMLSPRAEYGAAVIFNKIYCMGGVDGADGDSVESNGEVFALDTYSCDSTGVRGCVKDELGNYNSEKACQAECKQLKFTCNPDTGKCVEDDAGSQTLMACQATCKQLKYSCNTDTGDCVEDEAGSQIKSECQAACKQIKYSCNPETGECKEDPSGTQTLSQCTENCKSHSCQDGKCKSDPSGPHPTHEACVTSTTCEPTLYTCNEKTYMCENSPTGDTLDNCSKKCIRPPPPPPPPQPDNNKYYIVFIEQSFPLVPRTWGRWKPPCILCPNRGDICYNKNLSNVDLDMRRKAETLKHKQNAAAQSRKMTWSRAVKKSINRGRKNTYATQSLTYTNPNVKNLTRLGNRLIIDNFCFYIDLINNTIVPPNLTGDYCTVVSVNEIIKFLPAPFNNSLIISGNQPFNYSYKNNKGGYLTTIRYDITSSVPTTALQTGLLFSSDKSGSFKYAFCIYNSAFQTYDQVTWIVENKGGYNLVSRVNNPNACKVSPYSPSYSNVPGKGPLLYLDNSVPLTRYNIRRTYTGTSNSGGFIKILSNNGLPNGLPLSLPR